jgi:hypothetical protein
MGSPFAPVHLEATVYNPFDVELPIRIHVRDVPYGWAVITDPPQMVLPARGKHPVHVTVHPSGIPAHEPDGSPSSPSRLAQKDCPPEVKWDPKQLRETMQIGFIGKPKVEAQMPFHDTYIPIGGIDVWTQLVHPTQLTCRIGGTKDATNANLTRALRGALAPAKPRTFRQQTTLTNVRPTQLGPDDIHQLFPLVQRVTPEPVLPRGPVTIEGQLTPAIEGAVIAVEVTSNGKSGVDFVKTDANGNYRFVTADNLSGRTVVQTFYDGDRERGDAESGFCAFTIK